MIVDIIVYLSVLSGKEHTRHVCYLRNVVILVYIKYIHSRCNISIYKKYIFILSQIKITIYLSCHSFIHSFIFLSTSRYHSA